MEYVKDYFDKLKQGLDKIDTSKIDTISKIIYQAWRNNNQVFIVGNGGSAATASHMACDLGKGTLKNVYDEDLKRLKVMSLTDNVALMTAIGNDLGYDHIFSQPLKQLVKPGDVILLITASGNSPSILKAIEAANAKGAITIGLLGFDGGKAKTMLDHHIIYEENHYGRVEDFHLIFNHILTERLSELMHKNEFVK
ncbi:MAG: SIS domain-containing protein [Nanoarchaeota archaeon]|nr:SIS domain-containing protein [Nanoarchaeota archaeon]